MKSEAKFQEDMLMDTISENLMATETMNILLLDGDSSLNTYLTLINKLMNSHYIIFEVLFSSLVDIRASQLNKDTIVGSLFFHLCLT